jgi:prepilin-type N-terminal cleavage/methylation domain-containing protein
MTGDRRHSEVARLSRGVSAAPAWRTVERRSAGTTAPESRATRAFTLVELMVVITIMAIAVSLLMPAFGGLLRSINYSNAVNTVSATLGQARALAIRDRRYTAVAFLYDTETQICSLQVLQLQSLAAGSLSISAGGNDCNPREAFVYRPATGQVAVELPKGTAVYGLSFQVAPANRRIDSDTPSWYTGWTENERNTNGCELKVQDGRCLWLFPMNDARQFLSNNPPDKRFVGVDPWEVLAGRAPSGSGVSEPDAKDAVRAAQTFAIQFSPDGSVVTTPRSGETYVRNAYIEWPSAPVDRADASEKAYDWPDVFDPENDGSYAPSPPGKPLQKNLSPNPEVFIRSADQLAVVDMNQLAQGTAIQRPWYVRPKETLFPEPKWLDDMGYFEADREGAKHRLISEWIDENAEILSFDRYSGKVIRRESP